MSKKLLSISGVIILVLSALQILAQPQMMRRPGRPGLGHKGSMRIYMVLKTNQKALNISQQQLKKIQSQVISNEKNTIQSRNKLQLLQLEIKKLRMNEEEVNFEKLKSLILNVSTVRTNMIIKRMKLRNNIMKLLTKEQQEKLKELRMEKFKRFRRGRFNRESNFSGGWMRSKMKGKSWQKNQATDE